VGRHRAALRLTGSKKFYPKDLALEMQGKRQLLGNLAVHSFPLSELFEMKRASLAFIPLRGLASPLQVSKYRDQRLAIYASPASE
jgi:hypothetical protein